MPPRRYVDFCCEAQESIDHRASGSIHLKLLKYCAIILTQFENNRAFVKRWATNLANEVRSPHFKAEVLSYPTEVQCLDVWLHQNGVLPEKGNPPILNWI
jgi:hypothetical protein